MTFLCFLVGALFGGIMATTIMAMLFVAKRSDGNDAVVDARCIPETSGRQAIQSEG